MLTDTLTLIQQTESVDEYGDTVTIQTEREVFCTLASIGQSEFYQAQAVGLKPECKFILTDYYDYQSEKLCRYNGELYRILRTYRKGKSIELTAYREVNPDVGT